MTLIKMRLSTFDNVRGTDTFAEFDWKPPAEVASCIREIYTSCDFFLTAFLPFFVRICTGHTNGDNLTHKGSKDAVWRKELPTK